LETQEGFDHRGTARRSRNESRAMAVPAMLEHGRDARGRKSSRITKNFGMGSTAHRSPNPSAMAVPAMFEHGRDARGTKAWRVTYNQTSCPLFLWDNITL
jgi:hypothetical protein